MPPTEPEFWKHKPLHALNHDEWEALCDGCGKCCLHRLEDADTREIHFTNVACRLLDPTNGRCRDYARRHRRVRDCVALNPRTLSDPYWLPASCAYRRLAEGKDLPPWHPLISNEADSVFSSGNSVVGRTICETEADDLEQHLIDWIR